jgi:eukaryotic-like serine/threonine-protein kinase
MSATDPSSRGTIGPYRIVARVGAGGMGEVFKGWDPRLERDVAIKVLHPESPPNPDRQRRLLAEGRAASALNHPNILRVYDADTDGTTYYLVSEWLEGKSLRDELSRGPMPLKRLLDLSVQIADGLAAAHSIGIVHRDIKPENVMLARDGTARIVDFGLARSDPNSSSLSSAIGHAATVSLEGGLSGTPAYMSPEQARGTTGDFRTDQFSFGALVYEMATGTFAFRRDSVADTLSAVLHEEPKAIAELNPRIPAAVRWIVEQCLTKDAAERYAATEDLARELRRVRDRMLEALADPKTIGTPAAPKRWRLIAGIVTALLAGVALGAPLWLRTSVPTSASFVPFASASAYEGEPAWSPDGQALAYVADVDGVLQVFVKRIGDAMAHQVTRGRFDSQHPFWAPSGQLVYFVSLAGDQDALWSVGVAGGRPELVLENVTRAAIDRDGKRLALFRSDPDVELRESLWWSSPPGSEPTRESRPPLNMAATSDQLAFASDGQLLAWMNAESAGFGTDSSLNLFSLFPAGGGAPREIFRGITSAPTVPHFGWLPDSRHVVLALPDPRLGNRHLWLADTSSGSLQQLTSTHTNETDPVVSPDGLRIAYASDEVDFDLVLIAPDGQSRRSILTTARNEFAPVWSPAGDQFAFVTDRAGGLEIWLRSRDGQWERPIVTATDFGASRTQTLGALAFSPDGGTLAYQRSAGQGFGIWLSPTTGGTPVPLSASSGGTPISNPLLEDPREYQDSPSWSPDGEWVAYLGYATERRPIVKKIRVGTQETSILFTGDLPSFSRIAWSPDGQWLAFQAADGLVRVHSGGGRPEVISNSSPIDFTWAPNGRSIHALVDSETFGHFALVEIDAVTGDAKMINGDLGPIPIAYQPIRGFSFVKGQGFLTSLASARSDIWLMEGFQQPGGWLSRLLRRGR